MVKATCFISIFILYGTFSIAQPPADRIYFDYQWHHTRKNNASFYRTWYAVDTLFKIEDHDMSGNVIATGFLSDMDNNFIFNRQGHFIYFDGYENKLMEGEYVNGIKEGEWKSYFSSTGDLREKTIYLHNVAQKSIEYDTNKNLKKEMVVFPEGTSLKLYSNGILETEYTKNDSTIEYYSNGVVKRREAYKDHKFISGRCYNEKGEEIPFFEKKQAYQFVEQMPSPGYDMNAYLNRNLHYPRQAQKEKIQGIVSIKFVIMEDGRITDVQVFKSVHPLLDAEALRVISEMPDWRPGRQNGKPVKVMYTQPISFKCE